MTFAPIGARSAKQHAPRAARCHSRGRGARRRARARSPHEATSTTKPRRLGLDAGQLEFLGAEERDAIASRRRCRSPRSCAASPWSSAETCSTPGADADRARPAAPAARPRRRRARAAASSAIAMPPIRMTGFIGSPRACSRRSGWKSDDGKRNAVIGDALGEPRTHAGRLDAAEQSAVVVVIRPSSRT